MLFYYQAVSRLLIPFLLLAVAGVALSQIDLLHQSYQPLLSILPYLSLSLALLLSHVFNKVRYLYMAVLLGVTFFLVQTELQNPLEQITPFYWFSVVSLLLPINILMLVSVKDRGVWNRWGGVLLFLLPLQSALLFYGETVDAFITLFIHPYLAVGQLGDTVLSSAGVIVYVASLLVLLLVLCVRNTEAEAVFFSCLFCVFLTLLYFDSVYISSVLFTAAGLILSYGLMRSSHDMAYQDDLTKIPGRRALNEKMESLGGKYVIAMMDVDHFKKFNDTHGHDVGDDVLRMVAAKMDEVSGGGKTYRYGGEEFCVVFNNKDLSACKPHLEAVRETIASYKLKIRDKKSRPKRGKKGAKLRGKKEKVKSVSVTISVGVAERGGKIQKPVQVIKEADKALYKAKEAGRNCLVM